MKVFKATGYAAKGCLGEYETLLDAKEVVVANTEQESLGLLLDAYPTSKREWWDIKEIDTTKFGIAPN